MPVFDLGYRAWEGARTAAWTRWLSITEVDARKAWKLMIVRRLLLLAWIPALYFGLAIFLYEYAANEGRISSELRNGFISQFLDRDEARQIAEHPDAARGLIWTRLAFWFFRGPQSISLVILLGVIGAPLIAQDVRSKAFMLYFSRPMSRLEYILGKGMVLGLYLSLITLVPGVALYFIGLGLSPSLGVIADTWELPLRLVAASLMMVVPTSMLMLVLSSLTREQRYATFGCYVLWGFGFVAYQVLDATHVSGAWYLLSPWHLQAYAQEFIFGLRTWEDRAGTSIIALAAIAVLSGPVLWRRISAPMRI